MGNVRFLFQMKKFVFKYMCTLCSAYDRAAIKFRGVEADINFNIEDYEEDLKQVMIKIQKLILY